MSYVCSCCGLDHAGIPFSFAADYPDNFANLSVDARDIRAVISSDQCIIDGEQFYLRGCLQIPIHGQTDPFLWGVWANVWEQDFDEIDSHWETIERENIIGPYKARLGNSLSLYTDTFNLRLRMEVQTVGTRPLFFVEEPDHLLAAEQANGISLETAERYSCLLMKPSRQ